MTERDVLIMATIARFKFPTSHQIARVAGGSQQKVLRRLQLLFHHGYIDRPPQQYIYLAAFFDQGNRPLVYSLTRKGAHSLVAAGFEVDPRLDWTTHSKAGAPFLAHTIEVAERMLDFHFGVLQRPGISLVDHHDLLPSMPDDTQRARRPFQLKVTATINRQSLPITVVPDRLFALSTGTVRWNFALELDRGTMDINSHRLVGKSSFRRKLVGYFHARQNNMPAERWGFESFRVLTVTPSDTRITNMLEAQRAVTEDRFSGLFLYTTPARLAAHGPLAPIWVSTRGDSNTLIDPSDRRNASK